MVDLPEQETLKPNQYLETTILYCILLLQSWGMTFNAASVQNKRLFASK